MKVLLILLLMFNLAEAKAPVFLHQLTYVDVEQPQLIPPHTKDFIRIARDDWGFDGVVLSMDALLDEFGHTDDQFDKGIKTLAVDLDELGISRLHEENKFQLRLDVDFHSPIAKDLNRTFRLNAARTVIHSLWITSYNRDIDDLLKTTDLPNVAAVTFTVRVGQDWTHETNRRDAELARMARKERRANFVCIKSSRVLKWSVRENKTVDSGSVPFTVMTRILQGKQQ